MIININISQLSAKMELADTISNVEDINLICSHRPIYPKFEGGLLDMRYHKSHPIYLPLTVFVYIAVAAEMRTDGHQQITSKLTSVIR